MPMLCQSDANVMSMLCIHDENRHQFGMSEN